MVTLAVSVGWTETKDAPQRKQPYINRVLIDAGVIEPKRHHETPESIHHPGTGRIRLADLRVWEPVNGSRVDLSDVEAAIIEAHERYGLSAVAVDPFKRSCSCNVCNAAASRFTRWIKSAARCRRRLPLSWTASANASLTYSRTINCWRTLKRCGSPSAITASD